MADRAENSTVYLFSWGHVSILVVLPRCSSGRMTRAMHACALLLLFKDNTASKGGTAHQPPTVFNAAPVTLLPARSCSVRLKTASVDGSPPVSEFPVLLVPELMN